jgi:SAM-dependent methyltransferase
MAPTSESSLQAADPYDSLAGSYDALTQDYPYRRWLEQLLGLAQSHGLSGRQLLDVGCGTGSSFLPLLDGGFSVTGCDISPAMLAQARQKAPGARLLPADMRRLPRLGQFDLVTCLDDALNYLLRPRDMADALAGVAKNLAVDGLAIWDPNSLTQYRNQFSRDQIVERDPWFIGRRGCRSEAIAPGQIVEVSITVFEASNHGHWLRPCLKTWGWRIVGPVRRNLVALT